MKIWERLRHAIYWRLYQVWIFLRPYLAHAYLTWQWHFNKNQRPHTLPGELIVSLTSYPARYLTLALTVQSLLRQSVKPDRVILWVSRGDRTALPQNVLELKQHGLEIYATDDIRSYAKIIPALEQFPEAFVATADDDLYYRRNWLEELLGGIELNKNIAPCHRAHAITREANGRYKSYDAWKFDTSMRGIARNLFATGVGGILYPPHFFSPEVLRRDLFTKLCPLADDVWLYWMARQNGSSYKTIAHRRDIIAWQGTQKTSLYQKNVLQGGNDAQIKNLAEVYGYPDVG